MRRFCRLKRRVSRRKTPENAGVAAGLAYNANRLPLTYTPNTTPNNVKRVTQPSRDSVSKRSLGVVIRTSINTKKIPPMLRLSHTQGIIKLT